LYSHMELRDNYPYCHLLITCSFPIYSTSSFTHAWKRPLHFSSPYVHTYAPGLLVQLMLPPKHHLYASQMVRMTNLFFFCEKNDQSLTKEITIILIPWQSVNSPMNNNAHRICCQKKCTQKTTERLLQCTVIYMKCNFNHGHNGPFVCKQSISRAGARRCVKQYHLLHKLHGGAASWWS
jgi:hypothetical protein